MFSGIIETIGMIVFDEMKEGCKYFTIKPQLLFEDLIIGESISVNGACLTVIQFTSNTFTVAAVPETLRLTNLNELERNDPVNLERSLKLSSRIGGHLVQGHIDVKAQILEIQKDHSDALLVKISLPSSLANYVVNKGYIGIDGMSITVIEAERECFTVTFIPHTQEVTIAKFYRQHSWVNIEVDMMGKYVEKFWNAQC